MPDSISFVVNAERAENLALLTEAALENNQAHAEKLARELVEIMQILHGPYHMEVGVAQFYLAMALEEQGKEHEALEVRKRARRTFLGHGCWRN
jgi:hypothetical protein